jgi:hypothetical protein
MRSALLRAKTTARRLLVIGAGIVGLAIVTAGPAAAGLRNHAEPLGSAQ